MEPKGSCRDTTAAQHHHYAMLLSHSLPSLNYWANFNSIQSFVLKEHKHKEGPLGICGVTQWGQWHNRGEDHVPYTTEEQVATCDWQDSGRNSDSDDSARKEPIKVPPTPEVCYFKDSSPSARWSLNMTAELRCCVSRTTCYFLAMFGGEKRDEK